MAIIGIVFMSIFAYQAYDLYSAYQDGLISKKSWYKFVAYSIGMFVGAIMGGQAFNKSSFFEGVRLKFYNELTSKYGVSESTSKLLWEKIGKTNYNKVAKVLSRCNELSLGDDIIANIVNKVPENKITKVLDTLERVKSEDPRINNIVANEVINLLNKDVSLEEIVNLTKWAKNARLLDNSTDVDIISKVKSIREPLPSSYKKSGNVAIADVKIEGIKENSFYAHSSIDVVEGNLVGKCDGITLKPKKPIFEAIKAPDKNGIPYLRESCTEYKILNEIALQLNGNKGVKGKIKLFTELTPCDSCKNVINNFANEFKGIDIEIIFNNDIRIIPKYGY